MEALTDFLEAVVGYDFRILWTAGRVVLEGGSPYAVPGFFYPVNFAWFMAPFGLLPVQAAYIVLIVLSLAALRALKPARKVYVFAPVVYALFIGQFDLVFLVLGLAGGWVGLALATLKPQIGIWLVIYQFYCWRKDGREKIRNTLIGVGVIYAFPFLVDPGWFGDWLAASPGFLDYASHSASLFGIGRLVPWDWATSTVLIAVLGSVLVIYEFRRGRLQARYWEYVTLFNPLAHVYSLSMLYARIDWIAVGLSWFLIVLRFALGSGLPMVGIPIYLYIKSASASDRSSNHEA